MEMTRWSAGPSRHTTDPVEAAEMYAAAFAAERENEYPAIDAAETELGFAVSRDRLETAARVLACPLKVNTPCWQHGRLVYAAARRRLAGLPSSERATLLDVGTAKGFSALCAQWALTDSARQGRVVSVDVIDPESRVNRNTVGDLLGLRTLREILEPWPESRNILFYGTTGVTWLQTTGRDRVHFAFLDGKHRHDVVAAEIKLLASRQVPGDVVVLDDLQIPGVEAAVQEARGYAVQHVVAKNDRQYAVAVRV